MPMTQAANETFGAHQNWVWAVCSLFWGIWGDLRPQLGTEKPGSQGVWSEGWVMVG